MSLEQELARIATALEKQNELTAGLIAGKPAAPVAAPAAAPTRVKKETGAPKTAPVVQQDPVPVEDDPFADPVPAAEIDPAITFDVLKELLTRHAKTFGTKTTLGLMVKHGADQATPKVASIPQVNYKACHDEATADLKKVEKK